MEERVIITFRKRIGCLNLQGTLEVYSLTLTECNTHSPGHASPRIKMEPLQFSLSGYHLDLIERNHQPTVSGRYTDISPLVSEVSFKDFQLLLAPRGFTLCEVPEVASPPLCLLTPNPGCRLRLHPRQSCKNEWLPRERGVSLAIFTEATIPGS